MLVFKNKTVVIPILSSIITKEMLQEEASPTKHCKSFRMRIAGTDLLLLGEAARALKWRLVKFVLNR
jgi:hypothetical protein